MKKRERVFNLFVRERNKTNSGISGPSFHYSFCVNKTNSGAPQTVLLNSGEERGLVADSRTETKGRSPLLQDRFCFGTTTKVGRASSVGGGGAVSNIERAGRRFACMPHVLYEQGRRDLLQRWWLLEKPV